MAPAEWRFHFTDAALQQLEQLGLDQDAVRTAVHQGSKTTLGENHLIVRHRGLEVEARTEGQDVEVLALRKEPAWPRRTPNLPYLAWEGLAR